MNKKLYTQIKNEWRSNLWLLAELLVVSVVMWYITDSVYSTLATYCEPCGFNADHCYLIKMGALSEKNEGYQPYGESGRTQKQEVLELLDRIQHRPGVEAASLSQNSFPYNGSNSGNSVQCDTMRTRGYVVRRMFTPDFLRVFQYRGANGETPEQLVEVLKENPHNMLLSNNLFQYRYGVEVKDLVGKDIYIGGDTTQTYRIGAALQDVRYSDFQQARFSYCICFTEKVQDWWLDKDAELCVRVRPDEDHDFINRLLADAERLYRVGNIYIANVRSFDDIRYHFQKAQTDGLRNNLVGMAFLLINIFLGLLGTFWFRTQQRRGEIALHKVHGATNRAVFSRLISEGLLLLLMVTPLAVGIDILLAYFELNAWRNYTTLEWPRLTCCAAITFAVIALMIVVGIWYPARKAMSVQPAEALHAE